MTNGTNPTIKDLLELQERAADVRLDDFKVFVAQRFVDQDRLLDERFSTQTKALDAAFSNQQLAMAAALKTATDTEVVTAGRIKDIETKMTELISTDIGSDKHKSESQASLRLLIMACTAIISVIAVVAPILIILL